MRRHDQHEANIARLYHLRVAVEDGEQRLSEKEDQSDGDAEADDALEKTQQQRFLAALDLARAEVLPDKGRARLRERVEDIVGDDLDVVGRARRRHDDCAEAVDRALNDDIRDGEHRALHTCGNADAQNLLEAQPVDAQLFRLKADDLVRFEQEDPQDRRADRVRQHRCDRDAVHAHVEHSHEEEVQDHVQNAGGRQRDQRNFRLTHAAEDRRLKVVEQDHRQARKIDAQV